MPLYHFDIVHEDVTGIECRDHVAARHKADSLAQQLGDQPDVDRRAVVVTDPHGVPIYKAPIPGCAVEKRSLDSSE